ncbi:MAG: monooxygenase [bacterium]
MNPRNGRHAVVIGASMGGLLAARALAEHFEQVTVLERDTFPDDAGENRKGVPQGLHAHGLLGQGRLILEQLFPGFTTELERQGAILGDLGGETSWFHHAGFHRHHDSGIVGLFASRPLLEAHVRRRLLALPNVRAITGVDVSGLHVVPSDGSVVGVYLRRTYENDMEALPANLVVDASGRGSRLPIWFASFDFERPREERVQVGLRYTTRVYRRRPEHVDGIKAVVKAGSLNNSRGGALLPIEGDRWILSMGGYDGDHAPADEAGMLEYARGMGAPQFASVIEQAEPVSDPITYRFPASVRRRYERLRRFPRGLLVFGDAICSFNPVYGQGMTVAVMQSLALRDELAGDANTLAQRFFRRAARIVDTPWTIVIGTDARILDIDKHNGLGNRLLGGYLDNLHTAALSDARVADAFLRVANLMAAPTVLLAPAMLWRVWRGARTARAR